MKLIVSILLFFMCSLPLAAQHNPYLDKKKKNRPSAKMARDDKKNLKKQKKAARKQMRRSKKEISRANRRRARGG